MATTLAVFCLDLIGVPYVMTPGIDSISAHHRPSFSQPTTIGIESIAPFTVRLLTRYADDLTDSFFPLTSPDIAFRTYCGC